jgi:hypothetical protein
MPPPPSALLEHPGRSELRQVHACARMGIPKLLARLTFLSNAADPQCLSLKLAITGWHDGSRIVPVPRVEPQQPTNSLIANAVEAHGVSTSKRKHVIHVIKLNFHQTPLCRRGKAADRNGVVVVALCPPARSGTDFSPSHRLKRLHVLDETTPVSLLQCAQAPRAINVKGR